MKCPECGGENTIEETIILQSITMPTYPSKSVLRCVVCGHEENVGGEE